MFGLMFFFFFHFQDVDGVPLSDPAARADLDGAPMEVSFTLGGDKNKKFDLNLFSSDSPRQII